MILNQGANAYVSSFVLRTEKLFGYILDGNIDRIEKIKQYVKEMIENILQRDNLTEIKQNREKILRVFQEKFWEDLSFEDVEFIILEIAPLMKYFVTSQKKIVQVDAPDLVLEVELFEKEVKEDTELMAFLESNPIAKKLKTGEGVTSHELKELELELSNLNPALTIERIQKYQKKDFLLFLRDVIGLSYKEDPKDLIEHRFNKFIIENAHYNSKQLEFLNLLKKVFSDRKYIEITDLAKPPLSEEHPLDYFQIEKLKLIVEQCNQIKMH